MGRRVYKYNLDFGKNSFGPQTLTIPFSEARVVHVGMQNRVLCLWVECEMESHSPETNMTFRIFRTGHLIEDGWGWRGTTQDGDCVWHVYERNY
jgi:hypothetical protein